MKRFFQIFGWICLGIFLQFKFNVLYGIVFLENLGFHERAYIVKVQMNPVNEDVKILKIVTTVHHSLGSDYFATVFIPDDYRVLNLSPYQGTESIKGYHAYQLNMKRRYRDVLATADFIIAPLEPEKEVAPEPILIHFENLKQLLHTDSTYRLSVNNKQVRLDGPKMVEVKYPQKFGM